MRRERLNFGRGLLGRAWARYSPSAAFLAVVAPLGVATLVAGMPACGDAGPAVTCGEGTSDVAGLCTPDSVLQCGDGTYEAAGTCIPYDPNDAEAPVTTFGPSARVVRDEFLDVHLTTEPGARIFYTSDGTEPNTSSDNQPEDVLLAGVSLAGGPVTLKFYAVDIAGNQETTQSVVLRQDLVSPGIVSDVLATEEPDASVTLSWTNPADADFAGVVVMREGKHSALVEGVATTASTVLYVGTNASLSDAPGPGNFHYQVIPFDEVYNYGHFAGTTYQKAPTLVGSTGWSFKSDNTVSAGSASSGVVIDVTPLSTGGFSLSVTNNTTLTYQAPKVVISNVVDGDWPGLRIGIDAFVRLGSNGASLAPGETLSGTFTVAYTGVAVAGVLTTTADLTFRHDPILVIGNERSRSVALTMVDRETFTSIGVMDGDSHIPIFSTGATGTQGLASRPGERFVWSGNRSQGTVRKIDTATWSTVAVVTIGEDYNLVGHPRFGPGGLLWVALSTQGPESTFSNRLGANTGAFLVAIDTLEMREVRRIRVADEGLLRDARFIAGTTKIAVANGSGGVFYVVDTSLPNAEAVITISDNAIAPTLAVALFAGGTKVLLGGVGSGGFSIVDLDNSAVSIVPIPTIPVSRVRSMIVDTNGLIWVGAQSSTLVTYDPVADVGVPSSSLISSILLAVDGLIYAVRARSLKEVDLNQNVLRSIRALPVAIRATSKLDLIR